MDQYIGRYEWTGWMVESLGWFYIWVDGWMITSIRRLKIQLCGNGECMEPCYNLSESKGEWYYLLNGEFKNEWSVDDLGESKDEWSVKVLSKWMAEWMDLISDDKNDIWMNGWIDGPFMMKFMFEWKSDKTV